MQNLDWKVGDLYEADTKDIYQIVDSAHFGDERDDFEQSEIFVAVTEDGIPLRFLRSKGNAIDSLMGMFPKLVRRLTGDIKHDRSA